MPGGKPPIGPKRTFHVSDEDWEIWRQAAQASGFVTSGGAANVSEWLRHVARRAAERKLRYERHERKPRPGGDTGG